ncbi:methylmalonyl-CoA mutase subunit beta [Nonlabens xiamenensis]|uniref:methylmalonyl-CoA mutase subunit beta n=1 Tax=Nonlabens xiamenensis TaxID=2341043 RepID=UPI000F6117AE|nr:methylmalonyl-CoA mutase subunit beta [Nonlabens xiamenensis]
MTDNLFSDFEPVSAAAWKQKIQYDLKGADYNNLITATRENIHIKPFYHRESTPVTNIPFSATQTQDWYISQRIYAGNAHAARKKALDVLERGAEGVILEIPHKNIDPSELLKGLPEVGIQIHPHFLDLDYFNKIHDICPKAYVHIDIIHQLVTDGNWFTNKDQDHQLWRNFLGNYQGYFSNITINTSTYQQAGANITQELSYFTAQLNEYLNHLDQEGALPAFAKANKRINIDTRIGHHYFFEIAKYRAYRVLTKSLGNLYGLDLQCYITATPSLRNKSLFDYNVNMLRTTTECMSAILGGADTICNLPYDSFFNKENEFGDRIARNQLCILKDEAYLNEIGNAAQGAYYIERITQQLVEQALEIFKNIEKAGGIVQSLFEGTIQRKIKESAQQELADFKDGKKILVGANKYPNPDLPLQANYEILPFKKIEPRKTLIEPIVPHRITESLEKDTIKELSS